MHVALPKPHGISCKYISSFLNW